MRTRITLLSVVLLLASLLALPLAAQESTPEATPEATAMPDMTSSEMVFCDEELIVQLYLAERYFGFGQVSTFDTSVIDKGPLTAQFDAMMAMGSMNMSMLSDDQIAALTAATPVVGADEVANCNSLGQALREFFARVAQIDSMVDAADDTDMTMGGDMVTTTGVFSGPAEVPGPGDADSGGTATVTLDPSGQVCYDITLTAVEDQVTAAHIHRGEPGVAGPPVVTLDVLPDASGNASSCVDADPAIVAEIIANPLGFYVNVHNSVFPDGASRAQLGGS